MTETTIQVDTTYTIKGLKSADLEIICLGLDRTHSTEFGERAAELTKIIEDILPPVGSVDPE